MSVMMERQCKGDLIRKHHQPLALAKEVNTARRDPEVLSKAAYRSITYASIIVFN